MDGKTKVFDVHTLVVEERPEDDVICRHTLRSPRLSDVRSASLPDSTSNGSNNNSGAPSSAPTEGKSATKVQSSPSQDASRVCKVGTRRLKYKGLCSRLALWMQHILHYFTGLV